jgi:thiol-disulfide isomerase/thioredoxin
MKKYIKKIISGIFLFLLAAWCIRAYMHKYVAPKMGFNAADLIAVDNKQNITINDYLGKVVIVSCFQTWCGSCAAETPVLNQLATHLNTDKFAVIYISDEADEKILSFRSQSASNKILFTHSKNSLAGLGIYVYPTTFLINKKGDVVKTKLEGYNWLQEEAIITKLIAE